MCEEDHRVGRGCRDTYRESQDLSNFLRNNETARDALNKAQRLNDATVGKPLRPKTQSQTRFNSAYELVVRVQDLLSAINMAADILSAPAATAKHRKAWKKGRDLLLT